MLAAYGRPDTWNWLLMFHLFASFILVAASIAVTVASLVAQRATGELTAFFRQSALRINLFGVLPGFIATLFLGEALAAKEYPDDATRPDWLDIAWGLTTLAGIIGGILLTLLQWWVLRRARSGERGWPATLASYTAPVILASLFVIIFLMAGKPGN